MAENEAEDCSGALDVVQLAVSRQSHTPSYWRLVLDGLCNHRQRTIEEARMASNHTELRLR